MERLLKKNERLRELSFPSLVPLDHIVLGNDDVLILCAGFEERAVSALKRFSEKREESFLVIVIEYCPLLADNRLEEIREECGKSGLVFKTVLYDRENPQGAAEEILRTIPARSRRLFVDISGMSRLLIVQLLVEFFKGQRNFSNLEILYAEASDYPPRREKVEESLKARTPGTREMEMFVSAGVFGITIVPELSTTALPNQPIRLIVFPSFNISQLNSPWTEIQPSYISVLHGIPPDEKNAWRPGAIAALNEIDKLPRREEYSVSTLDYRDTFRCLLDIYSLYGDMQKLVIAPTGSKMQAVAVGIFKAYFDDVQIVYPTPRTFSKPDDYTIGTRQIYRLSLDKFPSSGEM